MAKIKQIYACNQCGAQFPKWAGQCTDCGAWNSLMEETFVKTSSERRGGYAGQLAEIKTIDEIEISETSRLSSRISELDRVLGGGVVSGSITLLGGDPGIGKSTLLLQMLCELSQNVKTLYVTGEESLQQVAMRAKRLQLPHGDLKLLAATQVEEIIQQAEKMNPIVMVIDSIQTIFTEQVSSAPGAVSQLRESTAQLVRFAKNKGIAIFLVGHVTKEGAIAGPRVLEHMVDTVLYFEGESGSRFRMIRAVKNRFGAMNELGVFAMTEMGLKEITNPSAIFLSRDKVTTPGSVVMAAWEGTRPLLVEVQALLDDAHGNYPKRIAVGLEQNRLAMLLAVLHRQGGMVSYDQDVFVNVVGGMRVLETSADLAILLAVASSLRNKALPAGLLVFGEVGLGGEIRPVPYGLERVQEAAKQGFKYAIIPQGNQHKKVAGDLKVIAVASLREALETLRELE